MPRDGEEELRRGAALATAEGRAKERYRTIAKGRLVEPDHVQAALDYLVQSAPLVEEAFLRARMAQRETKRVWASALRVAPSDLCRNKEEREAWVEASDPYQRAIGAEISAEAALRGHYARRETARIVIEAWQTASANRRANVL